MAEKCRHLCVYCAEPLEPRHQAAPNKKPEETGT